MLNADVVLDHDLCHYMTSIAWDGGPILRNGAVGTGQACCCAPFSCTPCNDCSWPADRFEFGEEYIECGDGLAGPSSRGQNIYYRGGPLPGDVTWQDGFPGALSQCNWALVVDSLSIGCCYDNCPGQPGSLLIAVKTRYRYRVMVINCPTEEQPASISDVTDRALQGNLEPESSPGEEFCIGDPVACTQWLEYYDSPTPVCNEFP